MLFSGGPGAHTGTLRRFAIQARKRETAAAAPLQLRRTTRSKSTGMDTANFPVPVSFLEISMDPTEAQKGAFAPVDEAPQGQWEAPMPNNKTTDDKGNTNEASFPSGAGVVR